MRRVQLIWLAKAWACFSRAAKLTLLANAVSIPGRAFASSAFPVSFATSSGRTSYSFRLNSETRTNCASCEDPDALLVECVAPKVRRGPAFKDCAIKCTGCRRPSTVGGSAHRSKCSHRLGLSIYTCWRKPVPARAMTPWSGVCCQGMIKGFETQFLYCTEAGARFRSRSI